MITIAFHGDYEELLKLTDPLHISWAEGTNCKVGTLKGWSLRFFPTTHRIQICGLNKNLPKGADRENVRHRAIVDVDFFKTNCKEFKESESNQCPSCVKLRLEQKKVEKRKNSNNSTNSNKKLKSSTKTANGKMDASRGRLVEKFGNNSTPTPQVDSQEGERGVGGKNKKSKKKKQNKK